LTPFVELLGVKKRLYPSIFLVFCYKEVG
jgi:hypothetical protein